MAPRTRTLLAGLGLAALLTGVLTACATPTGGTPSTAPSSTTSTDDDDDQGELDLAAAWLDGGRMVGLVTLGSSTCIPTADDISLDGAVLSVTLVETEGDTPCTMDLVPRVTLVGLPAGVDPTQDLEIQVRGEGFAGSTDLDGVPSLTGGGETDYLPSAGFTQVDGQFVILSWGSSSCAPVVENTEATSATEITVTFATPPDDQVCTMDMAPRGVVTAVLEMEDDDADVFAILEGAEFDNVRIPIYPN